MATEITLRDLLQAGVHFGHKAQYWNPKMARYLFGVRNRIHIIDLSKTLPALQRAVGFARELASHNNRLLFVGTKRAAGKAIKEQAQRAGMPYVSHRWLGGMLTNYKTIRSSIRRLHQLESEREDSAFTKLTKKEVQKMTREIEKLERSIGGIKDMPGLPDALFVVDISHEHIAISEAARLSIPIIAVVDSNSDPEAVDYAIPGNDDAIRAIQLYVTAIADACIEGREMAAPEGAAVEDDEDADREDAS